MAEVFDLAAGSRQRVRSVLRLGQPLLEENHEEGRDGLKPSVARNEQEHGVRHESAPLRVRQLAGRQVHEVVLEPILGDELLLKFESLAVATRGNDLEGPVSVVDLLERLTPVLLVRTALVRRSLPFRARPRR